MDFNNSSNINNTSNIYNLDMDLVRALQELSKQTAPEIDNFFHYCNSVKEVMEMSGIKPDENNLEYINTLKKYTDEEFNNICYENIKIEGEEKPGIPQNLTEEQEKEYLETEEILDEVINNKIE